MGLPANRLSLSEFLDWENSQPQRHEFHGGEVFAMVGARRAHGRVVLNLARRISETLEGSPCQAFVENMKVLVAQDTVLYPDVFVTCDSTDLATDMIFKAPVLVVDGGTVLSTPDQLAGAKVSARVVEETKGPKVNGFTYKNKSNNRRRWGHRQTYAVIEITGISAG